MEKEITFEVNNNEIDFVLTENSLKIGLLSNNHTYDDILLSYEDKNKLIEFLTSDFVHRINP